MFTYLHLHVYIHFHVYIYLRLFIVFGSEANHILLDCERLDIKRRTLFGCQQPGNESDASIGQELLDLGLPN